MHSNLFGLIFLDGGEKSDEIIQKVRAALINMAKCQFIQRWEISVWFWNQNLRLWSLKPVGPNLLCPTDQFSYYVVAHYSYLDVVVVSSGHSRAFHVALDIYGLTYRYAPTFFI